jgi:hypothetical protein
MRERTGVARQHVIDGRRAGRIMRATDQVSTKEDRISSNAVCLGCGYPLRGLSQAVCPECGRAFDPEDPKSFRDRGVRPRWPSFADAPPNWQLIVLAGLTLMYLYWSSQPGGLSAALSFGACLVVPFGLAILATLAIDFVGRVLAVRASRRRAALDRVRPRRKGWWRWAVLPVCLAMVVSAAELSWPLRVRFHLSKPSFVQAVQQIEAGIDPGSLPKRIGLFPVTYIHLYEDGAIFFRTGSSGWDSVGVAYRPSDLPKRKNRVRLAPQWFTEMW